VSVLLPVDSTSFTDPHPSAVDEDASRFGEFSRGRPPEFELDGETQLKVPAPPPSLKELQLPEQERREKRQKLRGESVCRIIKMNVKVTGVWLQRRTEKN